MLYIRRVRCQKSQWNAAGGRLACACGALSNRERVQRKGAAYRQPLRSLGQSAKKFEKSIDFCIFLMYNVKQENKSAQKCDTFFCSPAVTPIGIGCWLSSVYAAKAYLL